MWVIAISEEPGRYTENIGYANENVVTIFDRRISKEFVNCYWFELICKWGLVNSKQHCKSKQSQIWFNKKGIRDML